jgi:transcriptional regulator with XRE-family HTH domain
MGKTTRLNQNRLAKRLILGLSALPGDDQVGNRVRERRQLLDLYRTQLAGEHCSYGAVRQIEAGSRRPTFRELLWLAFQLRTHPVYLAFGVPPKILDDDAKEVVRSLLAVNPATLEKIRLDTMRNYWRRKS